MRAKFVNEEYGQKDLIRMTDIKTKAAGDEAKEISLAKTQAAIITNAAKAKARSEAAEEVFGKDSEIANIFNDRAIDLGGKYVRSTASKGYLAPVKEPAAKGEKLERGFHAGKWLPSERIIKDKQVAPPEKKGGFVRGLSASQALGVGKYSESVEWEDVWKNSWTGNPIRSLGSVDLTTGSAKYFNVKNNWDPDSTAEVWKVLNTDSSKPLYKLLFTSSKTPNYKLGNKADFKSDQTGQIIFSGQLVDYIDLGHLSELVRVYKKGSMFGYTYK